MTGFQDFKCQESVSLNSFRPRPHHRQVYIVIIVTDRLRSRIGSTRILPVIIGTITKLDGNGIGMCKHTLKPMSMSFGVGDP